MKKIGFFVLVGLLITLMAFSAFAATYDCSIGVHELLPEQWAARPSCGSSWAAYQCCARCDYYIQTNVQVAEHNYVDGVCTYCGDVASSEGDETTSGGDSLPEAPYDCSVSGHKYDEYGYCIGCGRSEQHSHRFDSDSVCVVCGYSCPHSNYDDWIVEVEPTCYGEGSRVHWCLECDKPIREIMPKAAHDWENGKCVVCGADSYKLCTHDVITDWIEDENNSDVCGEESFIYRECTLCGHKEYKNGINGHTYGEWSLREKPSCGDWYRYHTCTKCSHIEEEIYQTVPHTFENAVCKYCGVKDESHVHTAYRVVVLDENKHLYLCSCGEPYSAAQEHFWEEQSYVSSVANHLPYKSSVICSDCGFSRDFYKVNDVLNIHTLQKGETISISDLSSYDCLYYSSVGACEISVTTSSGSVAKITFPSLKKGEKLLVDAKTGFYSIWSDAVSEEKILVDSKYVTDNAGYYYQFAPIVESVPNPLDRVNAYFESAHLDIYDYPDNDKLKDGTGFNRPYPGTGRGSANNIMFISFPFETLQDIKNSLDEYPLYLVLYDGTKVAIKSVTSTSDPFIASYVALNGSNGGTNGGHITGGDSYAQGYADAYNTLTNAVIADNPIQGFMQGMWYGVLAMVTILGNGISIGGISLFSVLVTVLIICAAYLLLKVIRK